MAIMFEGEPIEVKFPLHLISHFKNSVFQPESYYQKSTKHGNYASMITPGDQKHENKCKNQRENCNSNHSLNTFIFLFFDKDITLGSSLSLHVNLILPWLSFLMFIKP